MNQQITPQVAASANVLGGETCTKNEVPINISYAPNPSWALPTQDKSMAAEFLAALDRKAGKFTFQFFSDSGHGYAEVFHGSLNEVWPKVQALNCRFRPIADSHSDASRTAFR